MKEASIFTLGGATFDIFVRPDEQAVLRLTTPLKREEWLCLPYGGKVRVDDVLETFGGGATNTAVGFARMGFDAAFAGMIGSEEYGHKVIDNLQREGVNTKFVQRSAAEKTAFSIILSTFDGDRTVLGFPGASRLFTAKTLPLKDLERADWIFLNHLSEEKSKIPDLLTKLLKKNPQIKLAWNPGHEQLASGAEAWADLLRHTEILFMNKEEAALFSRRPYKLAGVKQDDPKLHLPLPKAFLPPYADDVSEIMRTLFAFGPKIIVITDGRNGAQASDGERLYFCPVVTAKRVDTLGAGDAFATGFTSAIALGKGLKTALIYGTLNSNSVVGQYGAQAGLLTRKTMDSRSLSTDISVTSTKLP